MAIKYYDIPECGMTVGVLRNTSMDAINKIAKMTNDTIFCAYDMKYLMPNSFRVVAKVCGDDEYNQVIGREIVKEKLMKKYYKSLDSKISLFKNNLNILNKRMFSI